MRDTSNLTASQVASGLASSTEAARGRFFSPQVGLAIGWSVAGSFIYAASQWAILVVMARLGSLELLGEFTLGLAISAPVFLLAQLQLRGLLATDSRQQFAFGDYLALRLGTTVLALALVVVGSIALGSGPAISVTVLCVAVAKSLDSLADVVFGLWQRSGRLDAVARVLALNGFASLAGVTVTLAATHSGRLTSAAYAAGSALAVAFVLLMHRRMVPAQPLRPRWDRESLRPLARLAMPLGCVAMLGSLSSNAPRFVLGTTVGTRDLGIFAAVSCFSVVGTILINAIGQAIGPMLARQTARSDLAGFRDALSSYVIVAALVGLGGIVAAQLFGSRILTAIYSGEYAAYSSMLTVVMTGAAVSYVASILGYGMTAARCLENQVPLSAAVAAMTTLSAIVLVPRFGIMGAAWSLVVGAATQVAGSVVVLRRHHAAIERGGR